MTLNREKRGEDRSRFSDAKNWASQRESERGQGSAIKVPDNSDIYKLEIGVHKVDFMRYKVGKNNPRADEGMDYFMRTYKVHWVPVPGGSRPYICQLECFRKPCAVCDWLKKHGASADPELVKAIRPKTRHLWVVNDKPGDTKNKLKVLDTNDWNRGFGFGDLMQDAINSLGEDESPFDLKKGFTATLTVKEQTMGEGRKYNAVTRIDFRPRDYEYPSSIIGKAPCLDSCLVECDYDDLLSILEGGGGPKKTKEEEPVNRNGQGQRDVDEDDEEDEDEDEEENKAPAPTKLKVGDIVMYKKQECEILKVSGDGSSLTLEDQDGENTFRGVDPSDVKKVETKEDEEEPEEEEDDPPPAKKRGRPAGKPSGKKTEPDEEDNDSPFDDEDDEEEEEDDEEGEEVVAAKSKKGKKG